MACPRTSSPSLAFDHHGSLHVGTSAGVAVRRGERFQSHRDPRAGAGHRPRPGRPDWAAAHRRLVRIDPNGRTEALRDGSDRPPSTVDPPGQPVGGWVAGQRPAVGRARLSPRSSAGRAAAPVQLVCHPICWPPTSQVDREGSVWVSLREGGVSQLEHACECATSDWKRGCPAESPTRSFRPATAPCYVATNGGISRYLAGEWAHLAGRRSHRRRATGHRRGRPRGRRTAGVWFASEGHLLRGGPGGFRRYRTRTGPPFNAGKGGFSQPSSQPGTATCSCRGCHPLALLRLPGGDIGRAKVELTPDDGLCPGVWPTAPRPPTVAVVRGRLWPTRGGRHPRSRTDGHDASGAPTGCRTSQIGAVAEDRDGTIWLGTGWGAGWFVSASGRFATVPASAGLPAIEYHRSSRRRPGFHVDLLRVGVWRVPKADLHRCADGAHARACAPTVFGKAEGMRTAECVGRLPPEHGAGPAGHGVGGDPGWCEPCSHRRNGHSARLPPWSRRSPSTACQYRSVPRSILGAAAAGSGGALHGGLVRREPPAAAAAPPAWLRRRLGPGVWPGVAHYHDLAAGKYTLELRAGEKRRRSLD